LRSARTHFSRKANFGVEEPMTRPAESPGPPLDLEPNERRQLATQAFALLEHMLARREGAPIFTPTPPARIDEMFGAPPEDGTGMTELLVRLQAAAEGGWSKAHGGDLAYIPTGGLYSGAIAAWLAAGLNAFTGAAFEAPALIALEESVLRWFAALFGLPPTAEGVLLSGGSLANQAAVVCARANGDFDATHSVAYLSDRAHHSLAKAMQLSGIPAACIRSIPTTSLTRIDTAQLRRQIERDQAQGRRPWLIVGVAGNTDTGSVDDLTELSALAARSGAWFHVDAAYGGLFALTERGSARLRGIEVADSITVDAHKGLSLPYGVAALVVRRPGALARAHAGEGAYMRDVPRKEGLPHYFDRGPELTRPFRGLLVWLPLHLHGVARFRQLLDRSLDLAGVAAQKLRAIPSLQVLHDPDLSIVAFRAVSGDAVTQQVLEAINNSGRLHVSSTTLQGRTAIRLAFLHPRTDEDEIDAVVRITRQAIAAS
jgi:aromatic-L-amino-acid decarboxylase